MDSGTHQQAPCPLLYRNRWALVYTTVMIAIADVCVVPIGVGVSLSEYVAACERVLASSGLRTQLHANGTNVEGDWDTVMAVVRKCHDVVMKKSVRAMTTISIDDRKGKEERIEKKLESVEQKMRMKLKK